MSQISTTFHFRITTTNTTTTTTTITSTSSHHHRHHHHQQHQPEFFDLIPRGKSKKKRASVPNFVFPNTLPPSKATLIAPCSAIFSFLFLSLSFFLSFFLSLVLFFSPSLLLEKDKNNTFSKTGEKPDSLKTFSIN